MDMQEHMRRQVRDTSAGRITSTIVWVGKSHLDVVIMIKKGPDK